MLLDAIDIYCERTEPGLFNEPLNVITNIAFLVAATYLYLLYRDGHHKDRQARVLIVLVAIIGIGSTLFHTFANQITLLADVLPISLFVFYYLWVVLRRFLHWGAGKTGFALLVFAGTAWLMEAIPDPYNLNHSAPYFPCLAAIIYIGLRMRAVRHESAEAFFVAATWFAVSLFFRIIDIAMCSILVTGTHFFWHLCNSVVLALLAKQIIEHPPLTLKD
jgi:Ceramidase